VAPWFNLLAVLMDDHADMLVNPKVIVEVLSPATADFDHGPKFELFRRVSTGEEYVLISQAE
jgi:Uma2 family endonuclease